MNTFHTRTFSVAIGSLLLLLVVEPVGATTQDVTGQFSITRSGLVLNRATNTYDSTITIKNTSSIPVLAPIAAVVSGLPTSVTLANKAGTTTDGNPYVSPTLPGSILQSGGALSFTLKFSNPQRITFTSTLQILYTGDLPPDPGEAGKATVAGIDSNGNGVRDDIERWIRFTFTNQLEKQALTQAAKALHASLLSPTNEEAARSAGIARAKAAQCLGHRFQTVAAGQDAFGELFGQVLNTGPRFLANQESTKRMGHLLIGPYPNDGCEF